MFNINEKKKTSAFDLFYKQYFNSLWNIVPTLSTFASHLHKHEKWLHKIEVLLKNVSFCGFCKSLILKIFNLKYYWLVHTLNSFKLLSHDKTSFITLLNIDFQGAT